MCNRRPLLPTLLPFPFSISTPPARVYVLPGAPCYLLLFLLLFPSASRICFPMCFFLRTSFLLRIVGGGTPHPLLFSHRRPLVPTPLPFAFSISINNFFPMCFFLRTSCLVYISQPAPLGTYSYSFCFRHQHQRFGFLCASFFVLLSWYALRGEALRFSRSFLS